jgi:hypothetical protein
MQDNKEGSLPNYWLLSNLIVDIDLDKLIPSSILDIHLVG